MIICAALCLIKVFPNFRSSSFEETAGTRCVIKKTTYLRCWLQLWPVHRCFAGKSGHAFSSITMQDRLLTYGCTVRRCDLQAEYKSQVEQPHRHLLSNALWHRCSKGIEEKLPGFLKPNNPINHLIRTPSMVRVRLSVQLHPRPRTVAASDGLSAIKVDLLQPGKAIGSAAAQSYRFLIDYRHSNMMPRVTSVSLCLLGSLFHRTMPTQSSTRPEPLQPPAPFSSFRAKLIIKKEK